MADFYRSERNFRRFEGAFKTVLEVFPEAVKVHRGQLSLNTSIARCRDAMKSLAIERWVCSFDVDQFLHLRPALVVRPFDTEHFVITKKEGGSDTTVKGVAIRNVENLGVTQQEFNSLLILLEAGIIVGPVGCTLVTPYPDSVDKLSDLYPSVEIIQESPTSYVLC